MADISAFERLETLVKQPTTLPYDGWILEIFTSEVSVRLINSTQTKRNVILPNHIPVTSLKKGMPVRLGEFNGQPMLLAILPQLEGDLNYAGRGTVIPHPPTLIVKATANGWLVEWQAVPGADRYHIYRNDSPDESTPDDLGYTTTRSILVPYEGSFIWFAAKSVSGLNESEVSGWTTDQDPPPIPNTFEVLNQVNGHQLTLLSTDISFTHVGFSHFEIEQANDSLGTGAVSLGFSYLTSFPIFLPYGQGTIKYYRIRGIDWAGNMGAWTDWAIAIAGASEVQDKFDTYGGLYVDLSSLYWVQFSNFSDLAAWTVSPTYGTKSLETSLIVEGGSALKLNLEGSPYFRAQALAAVSWDLSINNRFDDEDYVIITAYVTKAGTVEVGFAAIYPNRNYAQISVSVGWNLIKLKKSDFIGSTPWSSITTIDLLYSIPAGTGSSADYVVFDDLRIVKADPDDTTTHNDTGHAWDKSANTGSDYGEWHIYPGNRSGEPLKAFSYGQIKTATTPAVWYLSYKPTGMVNIWAGTIQAGLYVKGSEGAAGLAFFVHDVTPGSWNMYVIEADSAANQIRLVKWVTGTRTVISTASFTFNPNQQIWVGADFAEYDSFGGRIRVFASLNEGNIMQALSLVISTTDTSIGSGGTVGLLSYQANVRFVSFRAGSPEHALTTDVAFALDGPIIGGENRRVTYNSTANRFDYSDDGVTATPVAPITSAARPGVTKLYRRDSDAGHNVQASFDGTRWLLQGYNVDTYHAPVRVGYADVAALASGINSGCIVYRNSAQSMTNNAWTVFTFTGYYSNPQSLTWWDGATALYAASTGWHIVFGSATVSTAGGTNRQLGFAINGTIWYAHVDRSVASFPGGSSPSFSMPIYLTAGQYVQMGYFHDIGSNQNCQVMTPSGWSTSLSPFLGLVKI